MTAHEKTAREVRNACPHDRGDDYCCFCAENARLDSAALHRRVFALEARLSKLDPPRPPDEIEVRPGDYAPLVRGEFAKAQPRQPDEPKAVGPCLAIHLDGNVTAGACTCPPDEPPVSDSLRAAVEAWRALSKEQHAYISRLLSATRDGATQAKEDADLAALALLEAHAKGETQ